MRIINVRVTFPNGGAPWKPGGALQAGEQVDLSADAGNIRCTATVRETLR